MHEHNAPQEKPSDLQICIDCGMVYDRTSRDWMDPVAYQVEIERRRRARAVFGNSDTCHAVNEYERGIGV
jgi:hypothetical protein